MGPRRLGGLLLVLLFVAPMLAFPVASATVTPDGLAPPPSSANAPTLVGAVIIDNGAALGLVGYTGWFGVWTPASNGTQIYSNQFYLIFFNLRSVGFNLTVSVLQNERYLSNTSAFLSPVTETAYTVNLPSDTAWVDTSLVFSGTPAWNGQVATPISFLPNSVASVGGLDLVALVLISFMVLVGSAGFACAAWAMRRARWAPEFRLIWWAHVLLAGMAALVFLDFQFIDATFAGWSPLVYPWATFPLFFVGSLYRFNSAPRIQIQQGISPPSGEFAYRLTTVRVGWLDDGRVVPVGESWWDFWARFWGAFVTLWDGSPETMPPFLAPVVRAVSPTANPRAAMKAARHAQRYPLNVHPLFRFPVMNPQRDEVAYVAHAKTTGPLRIPYPWLSWHRTVEVPAEYAAGPNGQRVLVKEATTKEKLSLPHYVIPDFHLSTDFLEDKHFVYGATVWEEFATIKDLSRVISKLGSELAALKAHRHNLTEDKKYADLRVHYSLVDRATSGISDEESAAIAGDMNRYTRPPKKEDEP